MVETTFASHLFIILKIEFT